jgi:ribosomal-protein-alanine N-acetyltransferase
VNRRGGLHIEASPRLVGRRVELRPLAPSDFREWRAVRRRNHNWLTPWEPRRVAGAPDTIESRDAFVARCAARERERQLGTAYGFGIFVDGCFVGEMNLSSIQRGPFQSCYVGYWIDRDHAGHAYTSEALVAVMQFAFEQLDLHRVQIAIIPRNTRSRRVVDKLGVRSEGLAERYLEINGVWEDHIRYAVTAEEWAVEGPDWVSSWLEAVPDGSPTAR